MGCFGSKELHEKELGISDSDLKRIDIQLQPNDVYEDLDTDNDQKGRVAVDHIFRPTREVYGQIAKDIEDNPIDWEVEYKLGFKGRPSPSDFPAFAHEKDNKNSKENDDMAGFGGLGLKEDLVELSLDIDALVSQTVSTFVDCAKTRTVDGNLIHVTNLFYHKAELFRKLVRRVNTRNKTENYIKELEKCANEVSNIVIDKASDTQEAFNVLSASSFLAKKTRAKAEQESKYVEPEDIVRYSHLISKNFSVCSPHWWQQGDPMRPFPTDMQFRCSLLTQSEGIVSPKDLQETKTDTDVSDMDVTGSMNMYSNTHDGSLRDLKMNDLPVLNDYSTQSDVNQTETATSSNGSNAQNSYNIGLISSDEDSSDSDF